MLRSIKFIFAAVLLFSFASCDNGKIEEEEEEMKLIPATISVKEVLKYVELDLPRTKENNYTFTYNDKYQLMALKNVDNTNHTASHKFSYNESGKLISITDLREEYPINATYQYDDNMGTVTTFWDKLEEETIYTNKAGLPQSNKHIDNNQYQTYKYDEFANLVQIYDYEKSVSEYEGEQSIWIYEETKVCNYSTLYSPYRFLSLPAWFYTALPRSSVELAMPFDEGMTGTHFPQAIGSNVALTEDGERTENVTSESVVITVLKSQDNYPTEVQTVMEEKEDGELISITTCTYTITYKEVK